MLEIVSALGNAVRQGAITVKQFYRANDKFLRDVAAGRLKVIRFQISDFIGCRDLLTLAGMRAKRGLRTQDAIVAYTARQLALEREALVTLLTSDFRFSRIVNDLALFKKRVNSIYLAP